MKKTIVGGLAIIEGVMFRAGKHITYAVKGPKKVHVEHFTHPVIDKFALNLPFVRGVVNLVDMLIVGMGVLNKSASISLEEEEEESSHWWLVALSMLIGVVLAVGLFKFTPLFTAEFINSVVPLSGFVFALIEGLVKLCIFLIYLVGISFLPDIARLFMYHGAEHKIIRCHEMGKKLTVKNVQEQSRFHPRCGTSFLFFVIAISILVYSFVPVSWPLWIKLLTRLALLPVVAGISYEFLRLTAAWYDAGYKAIAWPGYALQLITTKEPEDDMVKVALKAFEKLKKLEKL